MGKKRKHDNDSEDKIKRKIRKLENKLKKRRHILSNTDSLDPEPNYDHSYWSSSQQPAIGGQTPTQLSLQGKSQLHSTTPCLAPEVPPLGELTTATATTEDLMPLQQSTAITGTSAEKQAECANDIELDEDTLQLLGEAPKKDITLGPPIHKDVANRWQEILAKGLDKNVKDKLIEAYLVPNNCELLLAPTLNPEVKAALPEPLVKRDFSIMQMQKQIGIALSALAIVMESVLNKETSNKKILKPISDACRILCDCHHIESRTRRNFVTSSINTDLKDTLISTIRDKQLFGENVTEKIKYAQSIQKSGQVLKNIPKSTIQAINYTNRPSSNNKNRLNFKTRHRRTDYKQNVVTDDARGRPVHRQMRPTVSKPLTSRRRSPAHKTYCR